MELVVYLAGHIHSDWREEVKKLAKEMKLPVTFVGPMENHDRSDAIGEEILGKQPNDLLKDEAASMVNNLRTNILMNKADMVLVYFDEKYKQWNAATDAGSAIALAKPLILVRNESLHHPLKELANKAQLVCTSFEQALKALSYIFEEK
ncbi:MAG TPA: YtoQ family protein [Massilibacterium sp.]|nr:YtoQ family protein [Massilibacterium sp.]